MLNPVASGETDNGTLGVGPLAPAEPGPATLAWPVDRVHARDLDIEGGLDSLADLNLVRAGRHDERVLAFVGEPQALLRDHRAHQDVARVDRLIHCCSSSCFALTPDAPVVLATKPSSASWVKTTWSLTSTSLVFSWPSASTCTPGTFRRLSRVKLSVAVVTTSTCAVGPMSAARAATALLVLGASPSTRPPTTCTR